MWCSRCSTPVWPSGRADAMMPSPPLRASCPAARSRARAARSRWSSPMAVVAVAMLGSLAVLAVIGPVVWGPAADRPDPSAVLQGPSAAHLLGTDHLGRDLLA